MTDERACGRGSFALNKEMSGKRLTLLFYKTLYCVTMTFRSLVAEGQPSEDKAVSSRGQRGKTVSLE